ncbi:glycosyltransferase [bacterium]|nr:glycosyltransferase [bacterium]
MNAEQPLVTVSMPAYNTANTLEEAVNSILNQTYKNIEIILTANPSLDNTVEVAKRLASEHSQITVQLLKERMNPGASRNQGFEVAEGKYIAIMDCDDIAFPDRIKKEVAYLETHPEVYLVGAGSIIIDSKGNKQNEVKVQATDPKSIAELLPNSNPFINSTLLFRNEGYRYREKFSTSQDYDILLRFLTDGKVMVNLDEPLVYYRLSDSSNSIVGVSDAGHAAIREKIKDLYRQRRDTGKDNYEEDQMQEINTIMEIETEKQKAWREVRTYIRSGNLGEVRKLSKSYFMKYKDVKGFLAYFYSLLPDNLARFLLNQRKRLT